MPNQHCACPNTACHRTFKVPPDMVGRTSRCPGCGVSLIVKAMGGRTMLALANVDGDAPTAALTTRHAAKPAASPATKKPARVWPWLLAGGAVLTMCCGGCGLGGLFWWGRQPVKATVAKQEPARQEAAVRPPVEAPKPDAPKAEPPKPDAPKEDPDKEAFARFVRENAQDPSGLEIITWGELKTAANGEKYRDVRFRCKLIGIRPNLAFQPGVVDSKAGSPVMLEDTAVTYRPDGRIKDMHIPHCGTIWRAK